MSIQNSSWAKYQYDLRNTGQSPYVSNSDGTLKWAFNTGGRITSSPSIDDKETVYIGNYDTNTLYAINSDGTLKWKWIADSTFKSIDSTPLIDNNGMIYITESMGNLVALDSSGTKKWSFYTGYNFEPTSATMNDNTIYVASSGTQGVNSNLYALNIDGTEKWRLDTGNFLSPSPSASPAIDNNGIIYVSNISSLCAVNPDGTKKWILNLPGEFIETLPSISINGTIYQGTDSGNLYAINSDGTIKWIFNTGAGIYNSSAIDSNNTLYIGNTAGNLYAINPDGTIKWNINMGTGVSILSTPAIDANGIIYIGTYMWGGPPNFFALSPNGSIKWSYSSNWMFEFNEPAIGSDGTVYIGCWDGNLYAFDSKPSVNGTLPISLCKSFSKDTLSNKTKKCFTESWRTKILV